MSAISNLNKMFFPRSVALVGASDEAGSVGSKVTCNLLQGGFTGPIWVVNPHHLKIAGQKCWPDIESLPQTPDLVIIATPPATIPSLIQDIGKKGVRAAVIITAGIDADTQNAITNAAQPYNLRIIGPNCFGLMVPPLGLNASFAHLNPIKGDLAFISQSGALISAMIGWSASRGIGFSKIVSLGNMADIDVGDVLEYLALDTNSKAILIYLEQITDAKKFMTAASMAARMKPVVVIKSGRHAEGAKAAASHTGALAGADAVYDAAFRRAGLLRVTDLEEFFDAAEILGRIQTLSCEKLAIITNGGGAGVLAVDRLIDYGGHLASLSLETIQALNKILPLSWSKMNPVDIVGDAGSERYTKTLEVVLADPGVDAVLVINCPTALASSTKTAQAVVGTLDKIKSPKPVLACWLGDARDARQILDRHSIPTYETPEDGVRSFVYLAKYAQSQKMLMREIHPMNFVSNPQRAKQIMMVAQKEGRSLLTELEAKEVLQAYDIPIVPTIKVKTPADVYKAANNLLASNQEAVVIKIISKVITHKSDVGGVALNLPTAEAAQIAAQKMLDNLGQRIEGFTVQAMINRSHAHEVILGMAKDRTFGPVILFGAGGIAVEVINDKAVALPPLNMMLAHELIEETRIYKMLKGYRDRLAAALDDVAKTLVKISQMAADLPEISELDINPLLVDENGVIALDARIIVKELN